MMLMSMGPCHLSDAFSWLSSELSMNRLQELHDHACKDHEYQDLLQLVQAGFPDCKRDLPPNIKKFWGSKRHLSVDDGLLMYGCRLFIPTTFCPTILEQLHEAHQGITRSKDRARLTVYIIMTLKCTSRIASFARTLSCHIPVSQSSPSHIHQDHSSRLPWISHTMEASTFW